MKAPAPPGLQGEAAAAEAWEGRGEGGGGGGDQGGGRRHRRLQVGGMSCTSSRYCDACRDLGSPVESDQQCAGSAACVTSSTSAWTSRPAATPPSTHRSSPAHLTTRPLYHVIIWTPDHLPTCTIPWQVYHGTTSLASTAWLASSPPLFLPPAAFSRMDSAQDYQYRREAAAQRSGAYCNRLSW